MSIRALPLALLLACSGGAEDPPADSSAPGDTAGGALDTAPEDSAPEPCVPEEEVPYDGIDQDCDGADWTDVDGDGFDAAEAGGADCDDGDDAIHPGTDEVCDGVDNDCDAATDEAGTATWTPAGGVPEDFTAAMTGSPAAVALDDAGALALCAGTWSANLTIASDVSIQGYGAVIDGAETASVVLVTGDALTVEIAGITLQNGVGSGLYSWGEGEGGGVACFGTDSALTVTDVVLQDNDAYGGGGLGSDGCAVELRGTTVTGNTATYGGGLNVLNAPLTIEGSFIEDNESERAGGGLYFLPTDAAHALVVEGTVLSGNQSEKGGAAFLVTHAEGTTAEGTTAEVTGSAITGNHASRAGGAVYQSTVERLTVTDTVVDANTADEGGGAFWVYDGSLDLVDSPVTNNVAPDGGGVYIWSESHVSCTATTEGSGGFWGNVADEGGALYEYGPDSAAPVDELLSSEGCDWGADDADNADDDLSVCHSVPEGSTGGEMYCDDMRYVIDGAPAFSCTDGRCGDEQTGGLEPLEAGETGGLMAVGAVFEATGDATLDTISAYIELTENTSLEFYLLSRAPGETGDWTAEWSSSDISRAGADWRTPNTDMAGVPLRAGYSYAFVVGVYKYDGTMTPYTADPAGSIEGIGAVTGAWRDEDYEDRYSWHGESVPDASLPGEAPLAIQVIWYAIGDGAR